MTKGRLAPSRMLTRSLRVEYAANAHARGVAGVGDIAGSSREREGLMGMNELR